MQQRREDSSRFVIEAQIYPWLLPGECFFRMQTQMEKRANSDRRKKATPILSRYTITGRRSKFRRMEEQKKGGYVDRYDVRLFIWALALLSLNILDALFTRIILAVGGNELNPVMRWVIENYGDDFIAWKFAIISVPIIIVCLHAKFRETKPVLYFFTFLYSIVVIHQILLIFSL
jgi:hypothetical protein